MAILRVTVDVTGILPTGKIDRSAFPRVAQAIEAMADAGHRRWLSYASGAPLPDGRSIGARSGRYIESIKLEQDGALASKVYSTLPYAATIERGTPERDLKAMLRTSLKVRQYADGRRYLIIPFRHGTPGTVTMGTPMSTEVHSLAKQLAPSRVVGMSSRPIVQTAPRSNASRTVRNFLGNRVPQRVYNWGGRLSKAMLADAGITGQEAKLRQGMVKFQHPTRGGSRDTQYLTFRVMVEGSSGWIAPARPGYWPAKVTADQLAKLAPEILAKAAARDYAAAAAG